MKNGCFIAFEGIDGSGKSTQVRKLTEELRKRNIPVMETFEPSSGPVGSMTRQILTGRMSADPRVIAAMFAADRLDHLLNETNGVVKQIEAGKCVISDRYYFSSYAYHSVDVPMDWVISMNEESAKILRPDLNIFIDISADEAMERITKNRTHTELFEQKSRLEQVRENYRKAFDLMKNQEKIMIIDGSRSEEEIAKEIWQAVESLLTKGE